MVYGGFNRVDWREITVEHVRTTAEDVDSQRVDEDYVGLSLRKDKRHISPDGDGAGCLGKPRLMALGPHEKGAAEKFPLRMDSLSAATVDLLFEVSAVGLASSAAKLAAGILRSHSGVIEQPGIGHPHGASRRKPCESADSQRQIKSGGGGNRTRVRKPSALRRYVRSPWFGRTAERSRTGSRRNVPGKSR